MPSGHFTKQWITVNCDICNKEIKFTDGDFRWRKKRNKTGKIYCSPECSSLGHRQEDIRDIKLICFYCKKDFTYDLKMYYYRDRIKSPPESIFCSNKCATKGLSYNEEFKKKISEKQKFVACPQRGRKGRILSEETKKKISIAHTKTEVDKSSIVLLNCSTCGSEFTRKKWKYEYSKKISLTGKFFCSNICALSGRVMSEETKMKIRMTQLEKHRKYDDTVSHIVSRETKVNPLLTKANTPVKVDWDIVLRELRHKNINKYSLTRAPIPDAIWIENEKLVALELEKKSHFSPVQSKMNLYINLDLTHHNAYDIVYLVWYTPDGVRREEWIFENGKWRIVWSFRLSDKQY